MNVQVKETFVDRPPRILPTLPIEVIAVPPPPENQQRSQVMLQMLLPLVTIIGYALVSASSGGRNMLFMIPMAISVIATSGLSAYMFFKERRQQREQERAYRNRLRSLRHELNSKHDEQRRFYEHTRPTAAIACAIGLGEEVTRLGGRLWERRPQDPDFGMLRLGTADIPSKVVCELNGGDGAETPLLLAAKQLVEDSLVLTNAPATISMRPYVEKQGTSSQEVAGVHSLGIAGNSRDVYEFIRSMLVQFSALHAPTDAQLFIVGTKNVREEWQWATDLPHVQGESRKADYTNFTGPVAEDQGVTEAREGKKGVVTLKDFWKKLNKELSDRQLRLEDDEKANVTLPFLLVVVDCLPSESGEECEFELLLENAIKEAAVSLILRDGQRLGAAIIFLVSEPAKVPSDCLAVARIRSLGETYQFQYNQIGVNALRYIGTADVLARADAENFARNIRNKVVRVGYGADLTNSISLLELYGVKHIEELDMLALWRKSKRKGKEGADWLRAVVGVKSGGELQEIYFNQDYDGVHGMIAGTTGSGKSELLLTLLASLAINYDPSILNFVLVDYKGGAAFEPFRKLPHVVDIVTNLDGKAVERMFVAIDDEMRRRSKILADNDVKHIVEYRERGYHLEREPFPHLFVVVDEFAEMITENKEYKA